MSWSNVIPWEVVECESMCKEIDEREFVVHVEKCPIGKKLKEQSDGPKKNRIGGDEKQEGVGKPPSVGFAGVKPGSPDSDPNW